MLLLVLVDYFRLTQDDIVGMVSCLLLVFSQFGFCVLCRISIRYKDMGRIMNKSTINIGENLKKIRKMRKISLQKMAEETKMSYSYLSGLENDKHSISLTNLARIADFLKVDVIQILQVDDRKPEFFETKNMKKFMLIHEADSKGVGYYFCDLEPKEIFDNNLISHENKESRIVYVLSGNLTVMYDGVKKGLSKGQGIKIPVDKEHLLQAKNKPVKMIVLEC